MTLMRVVARSSCRSQAPLSAAAAAPMAINATRMRMTLLTAVVVELAAGRSRSWRRGLQFFGARNDWWQSRLFQRAVDHRQDDQRATHRLELSIQLRREIV